MVSLSLKFGKMSRLKKQAIMALADVLMLLFALWAAFSLRWGTWFIPNIYETGLILAAPILAIPVFIRFGLYRAIIRYIGFKALWAVVQAVSLYALLWALLVLLSGVPGIPRSVTLINWVIAILLIGGSRMVARWYFLDLITTDIAAEKKIKPKNIVIYGAGSAGIQLASVLSYSNSFKPVAFIDDKSELHHQNIGSLRVRPFHALGGLIEDHDIEEVLLAIPSASRARRNEVVQSLEPYPVHVRTLPAMTDIAGGEIKIEDIKEVEIEDLLGRDQIEPQPDLLKKNIHGKVVMVTGAGGSIGSELCRQILKQEPERLILYEQHEWALYNIDSELEGGRGLLSGYGDLNTPDRIIPILGTVLDQHRLEEVCTAFGVHTIYHAAAYKHVPIVESNPSEAVNNNILGTLRAVNAALKTDVETFVLVSTDKAVRPTNTMGASKRFAELILQGLSGQEAVKTCFTMVRFGNVLESSGSVIPLFRKQIRLGGPVTVTDPKIIRYFMTIPEAAQLVIQAGAMGKGGDVFVLDMGEPVRILDLARRMIRLSGLEIRDQDNPNGDIEIQFTGLRPGEKLFEELLIGDDVQSTSHPLIMKANEEVIAWNELQVFIDALSVALEKYDQEEIRKILTEAISGFRPQCGIEDIIYKVKGNAVEPLREGGKDQ